MAPRRRSETYYDILKLRRDCSDKEIRNAFVKLSKQFHPDVKGPNANTAQFIRISEAYQTLSKPRLRKNYDNFLKTAASSTPDRNTYSSGIHRPWEVKPDINPNPGPYYGIKGLNRISNGTIAIAFLVFGILGGLTGMSLVRHSFAQSQNRRDKISEQATAHHKKLREEVKKIDKKEQIRRVVKRIKGNEKK